MEPNLFATTVYDTQRFPPEQPMLATAKYVPSSPLSIRRLALPEEPCLVCYHTDASTCSALCEKLAQHNIKFTTVDLDPLIETLRRDHPERLRAPPPPPVSAARTRQTQQHTPLPPTRISPYLYIASCEDMRDQAFCERVDAVVHAVPECDCKLPGTMPQLRIPIEDRPDADLGAAIKESNDFLLDCVREGKVVAVHCGAGLSRAPTLVIAYLMAHEHMTYVQAEAYVRKRRPICINWGFNIFLNCFNPPRTT